MELFSLEPQLIEIIVQLYTHPKQTILVVTQQESEAKKIEAALRDLSNGFLAEEDILFIPGFFQTGVFRFESARKTIGKRLGAAQSLGRHFPRLLLCSVAGFSRSFPQPEWITQHAIHLQTQAPCDPEQFIKDLEKRAYLRVQKVEDIGEYCTRGSIIDFWTPGERSPSRIEIFDDTLQKIRSFRIDDQRSFAMKDSLSVLPSREFVWPDDKETDNALEKFNAALLSQKIMGTQRTHLLENLQVHIPFAGIDDLYQLFSPQTFPAFYEVALKQAEQLGRTLILTHIESRQKIEKAFTDLATLYNSSFLAAANTNHLAPKLEQVFPHFQQTQQFFLTKSDNTISSYTIPDSIETSLRIIEKQKTKEKLQKIKELLQKTESSPECVNNLLVLSHSEDSFLEFCGLAQKYLPEFIHLDQAQTLRPFSVGSLINSGSASQPDASNKIQGIFANVSGGFYLPQTKTLALAESWLRGIPNPDKLENEYDGKTPNSPQNSKVLSQIFLSEQFADFTEGDRVVHVQHGIGRFCGLMSIKILDITGDFLAIEYLGGDKIYVPVHKLNLVQKYLGASAEAPLDSLKGSSWEKRKEKVRSEIEKIAKELLEYQAKRAMTPGHAFSKIDEEYIAFEDAFPFEETPDQRQALQEIMHDMGQPKAMDRLLCGDVGFGKTEVAMRAAYRCILDGKQVAWLVPTTVLAHQHARSLKERFANFPVRIHILDRSVTASAQVLDLVKKGAVDVLIGTHRLLSQQLQFHDLGLLIVDEEQRFGVLQKEKIKAMSYGVDVLTMTATPIPRTLQMAMCGLRDLSLLTTPPKARLATKTFVCPLEDTIVKDALAFEVSRGGQIFYVHNRTEDLEGVKAYLQGLLPELRIVCGHGKMPQKELEKTILAFLDGKFDLLLCTTIVESGIDMPNVNTIMVQNADHYGLAQLYQLRGRVGRRSTRGYAYFLTSPDAEKNAAGMQRLDILKERQELGSGFIVASHDLEMRGGGNILSDEQSGKTNDVGLETYLHMLDDAIKTLGGQKVVPTAEVEIQIPLPTQIPENYIENAKERLRTYRRFFGTRTEDMLEQLMAECEDRFGTLPAEVKNLAELVRIRRWLLSCGVISLIVGGDTTELRFASHILQPEASDSETSEALFKRILDLCNHKIKGMKLTPDWKIIFPVRARQFADNPQAALQELKRNISLLAGEVA